jgi:hypothetical protein
MIGFAMQFWDSATPSGRRSATFLVPKAIRTGTAGLGDGGIGVCDYYGGTVNPTAAPRD